MSDKTYKNDDVNEDDDTEDIVIEFQKKIRDTKDVHEKFDAITKALFKFNVCGKSGEQGCPFFPAYNELEYLHDEFDYDLNSEEEEASNPTQAQAKYGTNKTQLEEWWHKYHAFIEKANYTWKVLKQIKAQKNADWIVIEKKHDWLMQIYETTAKNGHVDASVFSAMGDEFKDMFSDLYNDEDVNNAEQAKKNAVEKLKKQQDQHEKAKGSEQ